MDNTYRILARGRFISNDTWRTGLNNNDVVIGPSGAGKTRGYVMPNILQCMGSFVVADTKGMLCRETGSMLEKAGYKVAAINLADCARSPWGYNPLDCIRLGGAREQDIMTMAACLMPIETRNDPFWERSARLYLESAISYVLECLPSEEQHMGSVVRLIGEMGAKGRYRRLVMELDELLPGSFAAMRYKMFRGIAEESEKTHACIQGFLADKLSVFAFNGAKALYSNPRKVSFKEMGREKTAVFLNISDTDSSMYGLANLFYTQALHALCESADKEYGEHRLGIPVRFIFDDFAANVRIPDFDRIISVVRSRGISISIILQSVSQLEGMYGTAGSATILNNCDNCLYLGGQDAATARYISVKADRPASAILGMPLDRAWLFTRGNKPELVEKYELKEHARYKELLEYRLLHRGSITKTEAEKGQ